MALPSPFVTDLVPNPSFSSLSSVLKAIHVQDKFIPDFQLPLPPDQLREAVMDFFERFRETHYSHVFKEDVVAVFGSESFQDTSWLIDGIIDAFPFWILSNDPMKDPGQWASANRLPSQGSSDQPIRFVKFAIQNPPSFDKLEISEEEFQKLSGRDLPRGRWYFHATQWSAVHGLISGVDPSQGRSHCDFSRQGAFYVGSDWDDALEWAYKKAKQRINSEACVLLYRVSDDALKALTPNHSFRNEWSPEWEQLIRWCRNRRLDRSQLDAYERSPFSRAEWISGPQFTDDIRLSSLQRRPHDQLCVRSRQVAALFDAGFVGVVFLGYGVVCKGVRGLMTEAEFAAWKRVARVPPSFMEF